METRLTHTHTHTHMQAHMHNQTPVDELTAQKTCRIIKLNNVGFDFWGDCLLMFASRLAKIAEYVLNIKSKKRWLI